MNFQRGACKGLGSKGWDFILFDFLNPFSQNLSAKYHQLEMIDQGV
jgi:hypothetical protein